LLVSARTHPGGVGHCHAHASHHIALLETHRGPA
jgi:hypothetical protein